LPNNNSGTQFNGRIRFLTKRIEAAGCGKHRRSEKPPLSATEWIVGNQEANFWSVIREWLRIGS